MLWVTLASVWPTLHKYSYEQAQIAYLVRVVV